MVVLVGLIAYIGSLIRSCKLGAFRFLVLERSVRSAEESGVAESIRLLIKEEKNASEL